MEKINLSVRKEMLRTMKNKYKELSWNEKQKVVDGLCLATGYDRKYAITILNNEAKKVTKDRLKARPKNMVYTQDVKKALVTIWMALNQICSKRLVPFLPDMIEVLERNNHLFLPRTTKNKLLKISSSTVDRLLQSEKNEGRKSICGTNPGTLLKKKIKVRTFSDWDEDCPGFFEIDLVCHCGTTMAGTFINTLVLTDIASGWVEFIPIRIASSKNQTIEKSLPQVKSNY